MDRRAGLRPRRRPHHPGRPVQPRHPAHPGALPRAEAKAQPGPRPGQRPERAAAGRAGLRAGPGRPGRAAATGPPAGRRGQDGAHLQPRAGRTRRDGGCRRLPGPRGDGLRRQRRQSPVHPAAVADQGARCRSAARGTGRRRCRRGRARHGPRRAPRAARRRGCGGRAAHPPGAVPGVAISSFTPAVGDLEHTFLDLNRDARASRRHEHEHPDSARASAPACSSPGCGWSSPWSCGSGCAAPPGTSSSAIFVALVAIVTLALWVRTVQLRPQRERWHLLHHHLLRAAARHPGGAGAQRHRDQRRPGCRHPRHHPGDPDHHLAAGARQVPRRLDHRAGLPRRVAAVPDLRGARRRPAGGCHRRLGRSSSRWSWA